ncbi:diiron oxygenase [Aquisediminimonas profunda]|uniref:diiron oxygenase n=1 Tax=Aquisediminimonas profunda TaxID=1550733 RepID=UPI001C63B592|nr:diiron oxygenase [Aquisediminimonas profunda]
MYHNFDYEMTLASSAKAAWALDDVLRADQRLDFSRQFLPEKLARTAALTDLSATEQRLLNQISAHQYLCVFGLVEEFILPFLLDHVRPALREDDYRVRALLNFAGEEAKHIHLFKRFHNAFVRDFPVACKMIGPSEAIGAEVLRHDPLAVALIILMIEWMTQAHYSESVRDNGELDPLFVSLLKHHWMEEAQHAKLDTLIVETLAKGRSEADLERVIDEFFEIGGFLDNGFATQAQFNVDALEQAIGRTLVDREAIIAQQHQAARWTYIGSGMQHVRFKATLEAICPNGARRVAEAAPVFS